MFAEQMFDSTNQTAGFIYQLMMNPQPAPSDDFDDICSPFAKEGATQLEACHYVRNNTVACEAGGYLQWTVIVICSLDSVQQTFYMILSLLWLLQLFILLATSADGFLAQNITTITHRLKLSESLAGVTLVAFGNGAPDIFSAIAAAASDDNPNAGLAFGQLLGGAMFITCLVVPTVIFLKPIKVEATKTLQILGFYLIALVWLSLTLFVSNPMKIWQPLGFLFIYLLYALTIVSNEMAVRLQKWRESKRVIFVKPAKTGTSILTNLERNNSIQPSSNANDVQTRRILENELPCQNTSFLAILLDFKRHVVPITFEEFKLLNVYSKVFQVLKFPCEVILRLTIPLGGASWCKLLSLLHITTAPIALIFAFRLQNLMPFPDGPEIWTFSLVISIFIVVCVAAVTSFTKEPKYYRVSCFSKITLRAPSGLFFQLDGFILSIGWVYAVCAEVVDVVQMLGVISHLSPEILGVTLLGWANSIGDLVADISLSRQGYSQMAFSAGFGGPLFNLLMGFGLSFAIAMFQGKQIQIDPDQQKIIMFGFMWASIGSSVVLLVLQRFQTRKSYAVYLYCLYFAFIVIFVFEKQ
ncbi:putative sodium/calcium exchanger 6 (Na(+)/Ca(2+)-exchange protein 6) [Aphelenchoides bicaudatus]|nr:putative sodium/calcium exchanger 6 (Na(+)/Ca(2+)-exchange protein 6) [Aphelenchoides bicaudatus]